MPAKMSKEIYECVELFVEGYHGYTNCADRLFTLLWKEKYYEWTEGLFVLLICLDRSGQQESMKSIGSRYLEPTRPYPWLNGLLRLTLGQANLEEVLALAEDEDQRCQAHYYAGTQLLSQGRRGRHCFSACLTSSSRCLEWLLASIDSELRDKSGVPDDPGDPRHRIAPFKKLAAYLADTGQYELAQRAATKARDRIVEYRGADSPEHAAIVKDLAGLSRLAVPPSKEAVGQQIQQFNEQAVSHCNEGCFGDAIQHSTQALDLARQHLTPDHLLVAQSLSNLGAALRESGDLATAESHSRVATEILRSALGENNPAYADSLSNLATLYEATGNPAAEELYRQSVEIYRTILGEDHPDFATGLNNLAGLHAKLGDFAVAEPLYRQALKIRRSALGEGHPDVATGLANLAELYRESGDILTAEPLFRQALDLLGAAVGTEHPAFTACLNNLANLYHDKGDSAAAEPLLRQVLELESAIRGKDHPHVATILNSLGVVYSATGRAASALPLMEQAAAIDDRMIGQVFSIGSDSQRIAFLQLVQVRVQVFLSLVRQHLGTAPDAVGAALDLVLRRKAIGAEALAAQRDALLGGKYPDLQPQLREWTALRRQIAQQTLAGAGPQGLSAHQQRLAEWDQQKERLEAVLARRMPEMNLEQNLRAADRRAVALALPAGMALVEFVRFHVFDFQAVPARGEPRWQLARYLAFVLPAGKPDHVQMIDLGEAEPIDRMIRDFRAGITGETETRAGRDLGAAPVEPAHVADSSQGLVLRAAAFDNLVPALAGCKRLLLAPDGDLSRLPFEVLPTADGHRLIDEYTISYLSCGRDVLRFAAASARTPAEPLVAADPDFDLGNEETADEDSADKLPGRHSRDLDRGGLHFQRLGGTRVEGERIAAMLGVKPWLESAALEGRLKSCRSPRILHLATHGFFLEDQKRNPNKEFRDLGAIGSDAGGSGRLSAAGLENPLLRSGLALAGVNSWLKEGSPPAEAEDGLLTAEDVSGMDLLDTDLVVLSACETGLGEIHVGEGVFGLRRAFVLAGARTLVMSLWKVPDQQTQELMEDFYGRILAGGGRADSLRQAQLALQARHPDPLYWGAFICQGDPRPLPSQPKPTDE